MLRERLWTKCSWTIHASRNMALTTPPSSAKAPAPRSVVLWARSKGRLPHQQLRCGRSLQSAKGAPQDLPTCKYTEL